MSKSLSQAVGLFAFCLFLLPASSSSAGPFGLPNIKIPGGPKINIPNIPNVGNVPNLGRLQRYAGSQFMQQYVVPNLVNGRVPAANNLSRTYVPRTGVAGDPRSVRNYVSTQPTNNPTIPQLPATGEAPVAPTATQPTDPVATVPPAVPTPPADPTAPMKPGAAPDLDDVESAVEFASRGESEFRNGNYKQAARMFRHALLDSPQNGVVMLMLAQTQFAQGQHVESAVTIYDAIEQLPEEHWGVVVANYQTLYGNPAQYTEQLRALEKRVKERGDDPVLRFLVGYHYGYIGYPKNAVQELDKVLPVLPDDQLSARLRSLMAAKAGQVPDKIPANSGQ